MHAKYQCSIINTSADLSQVFVTDGRMNFNAPHFHQSAGWEKGSKMQADWSAGLPLDRSI